MIHGASEGLGKECLGCCCWNMNIANTQGVGELRGRRALTNGGPQRHRGLSIRALQAHIQRHGEVLSFPAV